MAKRHPSLIPLSQDHHHGLALERNSQDAEEVGVDLNLYHSYAQKAKDFLSELVQGKEVKLVYDPMNEGTGHKDKYKRLHAYVYDMRGFSEKDKGACCWNVLEDGERYDHLNEKLIQLGYAVVYRKSDFQHLEQFLKREAEAKRHQAGIWQAPAQTSSTLSDPELPAGRTA